MRGVLPIVRYSSLCILYLQVIYTYKPMHPPHLYSKLLQCFLLFCPLLLDYSKNQKVTQMTLLVIGEGILHWSALILNTNFSDWRTNACCESLVRPPHNSIQNTKPIPLQLLPCELMLVLVQWPMSSTALTDDQYGDSEAYWSGFN